VRICRGNEGMSRCQPSLYFYDRQTGYVIDPPPTAEEWAWLEENRKLIYTCVRRVLSRRIVRMIDDREILTTVAAPALCALRNWRADGGASKPTLVFRYVLNHLAVVARHMFVVRGGPTKSIRHPPVLAGSCDLPEILEADKTSSNTTDPVFLESCMRWLDDRRRFVVESFLGAGKKQQTMSAIGKELGVSRERVRQLYVDSIATLRELYGYAGDRPVGPNNVKLPWAPRKTRQEQLVSQRRADRLSRARRKAEAPIDS